MFGGHVSNKRNYKARNKRYQFKKYIAPTFTETENNRCMKTAQEEGREKKWCSQTEDSDTSVDKQELHNIL